MAGGGGRLKERGRLNNFLPLKRGGGAYLRGGLHRGFTVIINFKSQSPYFAVLSSLQAMKTSYQ